jgi:hypothetical protein
MGLCDVSTLADVLAMSAGNDPNTDYWAQPTASKRMDAIGYTSAALVADATAANTQQYLDLTGGRIIIPTARPNVGMSLYAKVVTRYTAAGMCEPQLATASYSNGFQFRMQMGGADAGRIYVNASLDGGNTSSLPADPYMGPAHVVGDILELTIAINDTNNFNTFPPPSTSAQVTCIFQWDFYIKNRRTGLIYHRAYDPGVYVYSDRDGSAQISSVSYLQTRLWTSTASAFEIHGWSIVISLTPTGPSPYPGATLIEV